MLDMLNNDVQEGDYVIVVRKNYRDMAFARVVGITPKSIRVVYQPSWTNNPHAETYLTSDFVKVSLDQMNSNPQEKLSVDTVFALHKNVPLDQVI